MRRLESTPGVERLFLALGLCTLLAANAHATVVPAVGLDRMVSESELIVRGTVSDVEPRWSDEDSTIYTYVTFDQVDVIAGEHAGPLTLRFEGGQIGDHRVEVDGMPTFRKGEEEILFVRGGQRGSSPVVGLFQGRFKVAKGLVYDHEGTPLVGVDDGTLVKLADDRPAVSAGTITLGTPSRATFTYVVNPDRDRLEAAQRAADAAGEDPYPQAGPGKGTGIDHTPSAAVAAPPRPAAGATAETAARPAASYVSRSQDNGQRLTAAAFVDAIRARLAK
jgi:hypothetical protein